MDQRSGEYLRMTQEANHLRDELARVQLQLAGTRAEIAEWRRVFVTGSIVDGTPAHLILKTLLDEVRAWRNLGHQGEIIGGDTEKANIDLEQAMANTDASGVLEESCPDQ
jgi:hypothetical protein